MARLRSNNVFGTTTNNPLAAGGTTLSSAGLANLVAVTGTDVAVITLDPNRVHGAPEIVYVTAHTAANASATILRGQEGTAARSHPSGTFWVHGATALDFFQFEEWTSYTPTLTALTLGNGTLQAAYQRVGRTINFRFFFRMGSTSAVGSNPRFSLPVATAPFYVAVGDSTAIGDTHQQDAGGSSRRGMVWLASSTLGRLISYSSTGGAVETTATVPFTWGLNDSIFAWGSYEAAS